MYHQIDALMALWLNPSLRASLFSKTVFCFRINHSSLKGMTVLSFSILVSLYYACILLYFFPSSVNPDDFALQNNLKYFPFCIARFKFFDSQGRFMRLGRTPFGIQVSMVVLKTFPQLCRAWFISGVSINES